MVTLIRGNGMGMNQNSIAVAEIAPTGDFLLNDPALRDLYERAAGYDSAALEAEHLRFHQVNAAEAFFEHTAAMLSGEAPMQRMSVIHPTGSGKTVLAAELIRVVAGGDTGHNVVMLVPGLEILGQTIGTKDDVGDIQLHAPGISVGEYSGSTKSVHNRVTVMSYQMLGKAIRSGHLDQIDPKLIICDEVHHVIDGSWAEDVQYATRGRLGLGLSSTPMYSTERDARNLFPVELDHMTMREGIQKGILSDLEGHLYKGDAKISFSRGMDHTDEEIFKALLASKDNYLAAALCAQEVAKGRRGIVSCTPGRDRAHAKVMEKILLGTMVDAPDGRRPINAAYIDGEMEPDERDDILSRYHREKAELDVIAFVGLLLEGWNSPLTDFGVWIRPTPSPVLAEQRLGRLLRRRPGKVATLHEMVYGLYDDDGSDQVTHLDILEKPGAVPKYSPRIYRGSRSRSPRLALDMSNLAVRTDIETEVDSQKPRSSEDSMIVAEQETVPYDWPTLHVLATKFGMSHDAAKEILDDSGTDIFTVDVDGRNRNFYSPDSYSILAQKLGIPEGIPEGRASMSELIEYCQYSHIMRIVTPDDMAEHLRAKGFKPERALNGQNVVFTYPTSAQAALEDVPGKNAPNRPRRRKLEFKGSKPGADVAMWLNSILINPKDAVTKSQQRRIMLAQRCLLQAVRERREASLDDIKRLREEVERYHTQPSKQMSNIMTAKKIDFLDLLVAATQARNEVVRLTEKK